MAGLALAGEAAAEERRGDLYAAQKRSAAGQVTLTETANGMHQVRLSEDFATPNGPDFFVDLIPAEHPETGDQVQRVGYVALGRLKSTRGSQSYDVPADLDLDGYGSVGIWCEKFGVLFSAASLDR